MSERGQEGPGAPCPNCESRVDVNVLDSRDTRNGRRRRRGCLQCGHRWTTYEISADELVELKHAATKLRSLAKMAAGTGEKNVD